MRKLTVFLALVMASPAAAASGPFLSLKNTNFIVLLGFLLFIAVLFYFKVPAMLGDMLDKRAEGIKDELEEARRLREDAQKLLADYERKQKEVQEQADRIVTHAKSEAAEAAEAAKGEIKASIARRLQAAQDKITSAEASAVKEVRDTAITVAIGAAQDIVADQMTAASSNKLIDDAIAEVDAKLH